MATALSLPVRPGPMDWTIADVQQRLDGIPADGPLDAGSVLPGFELSLKDWFSRAQRRTPRRKKR